MNSLRQGPGGSVNLASTAEPMNPHCWGGACASELAGQSVAKWAERNPASSVRLVQPDFCIALLRWVLTV